ncbi:MAG: hypothetical protein H6735_04710 [Alphaproteobacteria bacterium]|nr:hypothetical protein [Alphaproteobacteria bacterium]
MAFRAVARVLDDPAVRACSTDADCELLDGRRLTTFLADHTLRTLRACTCGLGQYSVRADTDVEVLGRDLDRGLARVPSCTEDLLLCDEVGKPGLQLHLVTSTGEVESSCARVDGNEPHCSEGRCALRWIWQDVPCAEVCPTPHACGGEP